MQREPKAPCKESLYGYQPSDTLANGQRGKAKPGSLRGALVYTESVAPVLWEVKHALGELQSDAEESGDDELADYLEPILNSLHGAYSLTNEQRALIVARSRAMGPEAEDYDKDELEFQGV